MGEIRKRFIICQPIAALVEFIIAALFFFELGDTMHCIAELVFLMIQSERRAEGLCKI